MKKIVCLMAMYGIFPFYMVFSQTMEKVSPGHWVVCGEDKVIVVDPSLGSDTSAIIWRWTVREAKDQLPEVYQKLLVPLDECKLINANTQLLLTSSGGATCVLDMKTRKIRFYAKTPMAHSADILPGNFIAVANSTHVQGNSLELYHLNHPEKVLYKDTLYSGHGAVWDAKRACLYALGYDELKTYRLISSGAEDGKLVLESIIHIPDEGGHDLYMMDDNNLLITTHHGIFVYNIEAQSFNEFDSLKAVHNLKSVNYDPISQNLVYTKAEESWWTFNIYGMNPDKVIHIPHIKLYKVRVAR